MKCYISSSCASRGNLKEVLDKLIQLGFRNIELTGNIEYVIVDGFSNMVKGR